MFLKNALSHFGVVDNLVFGKQIIFCCLLMIKTVRIMSLVDKSMYKLVLQK